ncbi:MAG TPA: glycosyltransferase family 39 protein, partial [Gemmatimonadaceae bacterium]|nr:glycosyltransferase family 39 protein [Gemmatimonadaceae bacterium]
MPEARHPSRAAAVWTPVAIAIAVAAAHLVMLPSYGASWDEPLHHSWGEAFHAYWRTGDFNFLREMPGGGMYYGPLFFTASWMLSEWASRTFGMPVYEAAHVANIAVFAASAGALFALARAWLGARVAWISVLLFVLFPLLVAHAQYNPKDIPLLALSIPAMYFGARAIEAPSWTRVAAAGLTFGVCFGAKVSAVVLLAILGVVWVVLRALHDGRIRPAAGARGVLADLRFVPAFAGAAVLGALLAWPSLLRHPELLLGGIGMFLQPFWPGHVLYLGTQYAAADLPWHYIPMQFVLGVPLVTLACLLGGAAIAVRRARRGDAPLAPVALLAWLVVP